MVPKEARFGFPSVFAPRMTTEPCHKDICELSNHRARFSSLCNDIAGLADGTRVKESPESQPTPKVWSHTSHWINRSQHSHYSHLELQLLQARLQDFCK